MRRLLLLVLLALMAACSSTKQLPAGAARGDRDGAEASIPPDLARTPDAIPRIEPVRSGGPNKPYEVMGMRFEPLSLDAEYRERGLASWYGKKFHGRRTASGEVYNMYAMTAAHPRLPIPSYARVRNPANGREVIVRVNDRGPFHKGRIIDLSYTAALKLDLLRGVGPVEVERITFEEIRSGKWEAQERQGATAEAPLLAPPTAEGSPEPPSTAELRPPRTDPPTGTTTERGWWVQLGAFRQPGAAEALQAELAEQHPDLAPKLTLRRDGGMTRVQLGPLAERDGAERVAERLRDRKPVLLQR